MKLAPWQKWLLLIIVVGGALWLWERFRTWQENSQDDVILEAAARHGVDAALVKAVVWRESRFNPTARGRKGEVGLMQIMAPTAREWAVAVQRPLLAHEELFDRRLNLQCGTWYLRKLLLRYGQTDNRVPYALADYNAGRGNVLKWMNGAAATNSAAFINQIGFPGTRDYVLATMARYEKYRAHFPPRR